MGRNEDIVRRARALCRRCGTRDPFALAAALGIHILYADTLHRLKGMYCVIKRNRFIILNAENGSQLGRIVCAHELGHDQLHRDFAGNHAMPELMLYDMSVRREYEANVFAAELLLDDGEMLDLIAEGMDAAQIAAATETDVNLVALKADSLIRAGYALRGQEHNAKFLR